MAAELTFAEPDDEAQPGTSAANPERPASSFKRSYTNLFPTFYATWNADSLGHHVFAFSFGRRIDRPYFQDLNPFVSPLDKFTFYAGNPNLLPTYANNSPSPIRIKECSTRP